MKRWKLCPTLERVLWNLPHLRKRFREEYGGDVPDVCQRVGCKYAGAGDTAKCDVKKDAMKGPWYAMLNSLGSPTFSGDDKVGKELMTVCFGSILQSYRPGKPWKMCATLRKFADEHPEWKAAIEAKYADNPPSFCRAASCNQACGGKPLCKKRPCGGTMPFIGLFAFKAKASKKRRATA